LVGCIYSNMLTMDKVQNIIVDVTWVESPCSETKNWCVVWKSSFLVAYFCHKIMQEGIIVISFLLLVSGAACFGKVSFELIWLYHTTY
jgi:hypothetical protein